MGTSKLRDLYERFEEELGRRQERAKEARPKWEPPKTKLDEDPGEKCTNIHRHYTETQNVHFEFQLKRWRFSGFDLYSAFSLDLDLWGKMFDHLLLYSVQLPLLLKTAP